ncbi:nitrous oxide reductase accessory protein NosL [Candidatus Methylospira mobilis]|uniref:Nitrous oxide reductase accessory protein NosL n=1 Tax=Candidatus Methylospira mobilis TaxID=1808979 RepID=A0A5Q0BLU8_9GAMM|nr:nitrous oxide reductase accessory protein NosL [Candidatus Methylospira mobilis]QFY43077.1 nitrous oxide reductase accessory protein NosL [Candidatus Methylospira mobilis]WNV03781.1 nitrous oxide reductase accessory protein NosL [Candidatus Methylospira mobilis]
MRSLAFLVAFFTSAVLLAAEPPKPDTKSLCPVCGMLVAKYPNWVATVVWKNGHAHHFDGAKDMFKFLYDLARYAPGHKREEISAIYVTEFYSLERIDAKKALFVTGSDVLGPMGHELVPLATPEDAADFMKDHKGKRMLRFDQVTADVPVGLDAGKF